MIHWMLFAWWGAPSVFAGGRLRTPSPPTLHVKSVYFCTDYNPIFGIIVNQIWYHCVQTIFAHVEKNIPSRSMLTSSRFQHLKVLSERMAAILFHVDISGLWNLRTLNSVGTLLLATFFTRFKDDNKNSVNSTYLGRSGFMTRILSMTD